MSTPISYSVRGAAEATGLSETRIKQAIHAGELKSRKSNTDENGDPTGKYVIVHADLKAFIDGLVTA